MHRHEKFAFRMFPWFILLLAIPFSVQGMYIEALIFGIPGSLLCISFKGYCIDAERMLIRQYDRFMWFTIGSWKPIPKPLYLTVVRIKVSGRRMSPAPLILPDSSGKSTTMYKLNLVVDDRIRFISIARGSRDRMLDEGMRIAEVLNVRLLDYTTEEKVWLK